MLRNEQVANQIRLAQMPSIFVDTVANMLRKSFTNVITNMPIDGPEGATDIDIAVLDASHLYLIECKHSMFPTEPHELRDSWEDIEKGISQLKRAAAALGDRGKAQSYLAGWFPGTRIRTHQQLEVTTCVLSSHRIFSGLTLGRVAIRDYASLAMLLQDGIVSMGLSQEGSETILHRFRVTVGSVFREPIWIIISSRTRHISQLSATFYDPSQIP